MMRVLWSLAAAVAISAAAPAEPAAPASRPAGPRVIVVSERLADLLPALAPVAATLGGDDPALILVVPEGDTTDGRRFLDEAAAQCVLDLGAPSAAEPDTRRPDGPRIGAPMLDPTAATLALAAFAWSTSDEVVVAGSDQHGAVLSGAALAARRGVPLLLDDGRNAHPIQAALRRLKVKKVLRVVERRTPAAWRPGPWTVDTLDERGAAARLVELLGRDRIRNLVLVNPTDRTKAAGPADDDPNAPPPPQGPEPDDAFPPETGPFSLLAPYQSLLRSAPLVLCRSTDGLAAERAVQAFIRAHRLKPRSLTIMAHHGAIGLVRMKDAERLGEYEVDIEPCSGPTPGGAAWLAVGRLGLTSLPCTSLMTARTMARERGLTGASFRAVMIANPSAEYGPLPLAETISRATAAEFRNRRLGIDAFYGVPTDQPAVREAAQRAALILYEGHITDQHLFETPQTWPDDPLAEEWIVREQGPVVEPPCDAEDTAPWGSDLREWLPQGRGDTNDTAPWDTNRPRPEPRDGEKAPDNLPDDDPASAPWDGQPGPPRGPPDDDPLPKPSPPVRCERMPLVILQSCHSLEEQAATEIIQAGAADFIGSVTSVHSASGSAFVKAFCDRLLYHDATTGEALRDARTYFLALARLKTLRGHKEHAKVTRVALTFRLWGDPEARVIPEATEKPVVRPIRVKFVSPDWLDVRTPRTLLPDIVTAKYAVRAFPDAHLGGIVRRIKDRAYRRLMPLYFVDFRAPTDFFRAGYARVLREGEEPNRATFVTRRPYGREVYVLYLPEKAKSRGSHLFRFARRLDDRGAADADDPARDRPPAPPAAAAGVSPRKHPGGHGAPGDHD